MAQYINVPSSLKVQRALGTRSERRFCYIKCLVFTGFTIYKTLKTAVHRKKGIVLIIEMTLISIRPYLWNGLK